MFDQGLQQNPAETYLCGKIGSITANHPMNVDTIKEWTEEELMKLRGENKIAVFVERTE